uniref:Mitochondrial carrier protein n=1 Tax=Neobodo designis TaxID=312471 RepID=A0A7S1QIH6_NEODS|mmetsp:Transcript_46192/g.142432  ORF Transcript_46192/g.142432 Transcript_46192/m.142432 type:complete len:355 (+) Transcript_46192:101-1165(+)|eukprot:CAMPEP_0174856134 /NCGR_PEP_ID=MMETSP1114-20130205/35150_1 /TAXON_ID=312471 /ORGANISM="Neobodo designis, Strain CCAP 1951/1" /LENGTH=354 /DNA_ID=CAMNT_0016090913 /DNA_START=101 /DNA_END=1165 /DNA_ORIENTATION=+
MTAVASFDMELEHSPVASATRPSAPPPANDGEGEATNAVTRSYEHLQFGSFIGYCALFGAMRTVAYHPMSIALARKQGLADYGNLSTTTILRRLVRLEGGAAALSTGLLAMVLANSTSEAIYLGAFELLRFKLPIESDITRDAAAGYAGDAACRLVYTPMLLVSNKQMTQTAPIVDAAAAGKRTVLPRSENGIATVMRNVHATSGAAGFFRGLAPTITVGCSWSALWWAIYGQTKAVLYDHVAPRMPTPESRLGSHLPAALIDRKDNLLLNWTASIVTSGSTACVFNPFLVVRTRLQIDPQSTMRSVCRQVYREAGVAGFWKGTVLSIGACVFDGVMSVSCYEWAKILSDRTLQ